MSQQENAETVETPNQALGVLVQAAHVAQKRGAFDLNEASLVAQAIQMFSVPPGEVSEEETEVETEE
tara:strand:+ start:3070 stop:3270 length:201 start_codon:yes stop_codon:yes gene_type:complete